MLRGKEFTALLHLYFYTPTLEALTAYGSCKRKNIRRKHKKWTLSNVTFMNSEFTMTALGHYSITLLYHSPTRQENVGIPTFITETEKQNINIILSKLHDKHVPGIYFRIPFEKLRVACLVKLLAFYGN